MHARENPLCCKTPDPDRKQSSSVGFIESNILTNALIKSMGELAMDDSRVQVRVKVAHRYPMSEMKVRTPNAV
jgi:hypothetical protein